ncbi:hypothetical protein XA68_13586 [Ophiocordyceps unilateralis]|uniref:Uncharacterized protein n=1 Tax=Ophiocordyceps unilateralis TaxID=268505 RepID=A0A2A9PBW5_OPHUN|nr:hypothetical protein XA68_13586 [Ophiocordyceps unilateralis]
MTVEKVTYSCGQLRRPHGFEFWHLTKCLSDMKRKRKIYMDTCKRHRLAETMAFALPQAFHDMLWREYKLDNVSVVHHITLSLDLTPAPTSLARAVWLKQMARHKRIVCWPDHPDFTYEDFEEFGGTLAALLVQPEAAGKNATGVRHRFMRFPPGFLTRNRIHYIYKATYDYNQVWALHGNWRHFGILGLPSYASLSDMRQELDTWGGRVGRLLMAAMRSSYECDYHRGCVAEPRWGEAFRPENYKALLDLWLHTMSNISPLAFTFGDVETPPSTLWVSL